MLSDRTKMVLTSLLVSQVGLTSCQSDSGVELTVHYPSHLDELIVSGTYDDGPAFDPTVVSLAATSPPESTSGTIVILTEREGPLLVTVEGRGPSLSMLATTDVTVRSGRLIDAEVTIVGCGDALIQGAETCDDGNGRPGDGCSEACVVELGSSCNGVPSICKTTCGDGVVDATEGCDDGNLANDDGCSNACQVEVCGDGVQQAGEGCDDGNNQPGDGCDGACTVEVPVSCGDGNRDPAEGCDDGNMVAGDGCGPACQPEVGFDCSGAACTPICGDGTLVGGEVCDDGNATAGDGCGLTCQIETGCECAGAPSLCTCCGNGLIEGAELCDDGNLAAGDGCAACGVEGGHTCLYEPSFCVRDADVVFVDSANGCPGSGTAADPFCSLAIAVGSGADTLVVRPGLYPREGNLNRDVTLLAEPGAVLEANQSIGLDGLILIRGLTLRSTGEAVVIENGADVELRDMVIEAGGSGVAVENNAQLRLVDSRVVAATEGVGSDGTGAALSIIGSEVSSTAEVAVRVSSNQPTMIEDSRLSGLAEALLLEANTTVTITGTTLTSSTVDAVEMLDADATFTDCSVSSVFATGASSLQLLGGQVGPSARVGIDVELGVDLQVDRVQVLQNEAGGLRLDTETWRITSTVIAENGADEAAFGGVLILRQSPAARFVNNTVSANRAATVSAGVECTAPAALINSIVWDNPGATTRGVSDGCSVSHCIDGDGADPRYVAPGDYHLRADSPAIDAGDPAGVAPAGPAPELDIDGEPRNGPVDIGADER